MKNSYLFITVLTVTFLSCQSNKEKTQESRRFTDSLQTVELQNEAGMKAVLTNYGAKVLSLYVPDREGLLGDVVTGYDSLSDYIKGEKYFGAIVGRFANRISEGRFTLDGKTYQLPVNNGKNHLHGGDTGFHSQVWTIQKVDASSVTFRLVSPDGENGYPGNVALKVKYSLTPDNALRIDYKATTDQVTVVNFTHHSFFNLRDGGRTPITEHILTINASRFTPVDEGLIPTGELRAVAGTPFDFTTPHTVGERINLSDKQLIPGRGYDHNFVLDRPERDSLWLAATVFEPETGRLMEVLTTEPGLQFYSGNFFDGTTVGKGKTAYQFRSAFCLEAQHFPDSPNQPGFPSTVLNPGETYRQTTAYRFSIRQ